MSSTREDILKGNMTLTVPMLKEQLSNWRIRDMSAKGVLREVSSEPVMLNRMFDIMLGHTVYRKHMKSGYSNDVVSSVVYTYKGLDMVTGATHKPYKSGMENAFIDKLPIAINNNARLALIFGNTVKLFDYDNGVIKPTGESVAVSTLVKAFMSFSLDGAFALEKNVLALFEFIGIEFVILEMASIRKEDSRDVLKVIKGELSPSDCDVIVEAVQNLVSYAYVNNNTASLLSRGRDMLLADEGYIKNWVQLTVTTLKDVLVPVEGVGSREMVRIVAILMRKGVMEGLLRDALDERVKVAVYRGWDK